MAEASSEEEVDLKERLEDLKRWKVRYERRTKNSKVHEEMKKEIGDLTKKAVNMETRIKQNEERLEADGQNVRKEEGERRLVEEGTKRRLDSIEGRRTGKIDAYLSPRTEKRKLNESPEENKKKEIKRKCSTEVAENGTETSALLAQLLEESRKSREERDELKMIIKEESRKRREEQEVIKKAMMDLKSKFENMETRIKQIEERLDADERKMELRKEEGEKGKFDVESAKRRIDKIEEKIGKSKHEERKWEEWERERKKNNIVIKGLGTNERTDRGKIEKWIKAKLGVEAKLNKIWIIKKQMLVGAECKSKEEKDKIMVNKKKLKGTTFYVNNDLTYKERRNKEELWKIAEKYREKGKIVKIGYNKIIVDKEIHKWDEWRGELFRKSYKAP